MTRGVEMIFVARVPIIDREDDTILISAAVGRI